MYARIWECARLCEQAYLCVNSSKHLRRSQCWEPIMHVYALHIIYDGNYGTYLHYNFPTHNWHDEPVSKQQTTDGRKVKCMSDNAADQNNKFAVRKRNKKYFQHRYNVFLFICYWKLETKIEKHCELLLQFVFCFRLLLSYKYLLNTFICMCAQMLEVIIWHFCFIFIKSNWFCINIC